MWSDEGAAGGGFNVSGGPEGFGSQQFGTTGPETEKSKIQSILPLSIRAILDLDENEPVFEGFKVGMIKVVALIRSVEVTSTKVTYTVNDTSGSIQTVKWVESEGGEEPLMENTYCRVYGTLKCYQGIKQLLILHLDRITNYNWVTMHILEVMHAHLELKRLKTTMDKESTAAGPSGLSKSLVGFEGLAGSGMSSGSMAGGGDVYGGMSLNPQQKQVFELIRSVSVDSDYSGHSREYIKAKLSGKVSPHQVDDALFFLSSEGHIYTTVDDDHFKSTDG